MDNNKKTTVTIYDVAKEADVSLATVSRVLNNTAVVRPERRERVEKAIAKLNFVPNEIARGLARKSSTSIGIIVSEVTRASVAELISGIIDTANLKQYGYSVSINSYHGDDNEFKEHVDHMISSQIDGLLVMGDGISPRMHEILKGIAIPTVVFSTPHAYDDLHSISINYVKVMQDVLTYFKGKGKKQVTMLARGLNDDIDVYQDILMTEAAEQGLQATTEYVNGSYEKVYNALYAKYSNAAIPEAVFAMSDTIALAYSNVIQDLGHSVPGDSEIISFSNTQNALVGRPQITSVMYPVYRIGAYAMSAITKLIKENEMPEIDLENKYEIIWRESTNH